MPAPSSLVTDPSDLSHKRTTTTQSRGASTVHTTGARGTVQRTRGAGGSVPGQDPKVGKITAAVQAEAGVETGERLSRQGHGRLPRTAQGAGLAGAPHEPPGPAYPNP